MGTRSGYEQSRGCRAWRWNAREGGSLRERVWEKAVRLPITTYFIPEFTIQTYMKTDQLTKGFHSLLSPPSGLTLANPNTVISPHFVRNGANQKHDMQLVGAKPCPHFSFRQSIEQGYSQRWQCSVSGWARGSG